MLLDFRLDVTRPERREVLVALELDLAATPAPAPLELFLPTWTPGSYLIREFARHLGRVRAVDAADGSALACRKTSKNRFEVAPGRTTRRVRLEYRVHAHELTVRTADVTAEHAFWNHACLLLWPVGKPDCRARIRVVHRHDWRVACSLPREAAADGEAGQADTATTTLLAADLDAAMDAPCLVGSFERRDWQVDGVPHGIVLDGLAGVAAPPHLCDDLTRLAVAARAVFGGPLPYSRYLFLCLFTAEGHGGLEHADSTTLLASRTAFASAKGYREFLGLAAHELFHAWNGKRMRPVDFWRYDYEAENHTSLLWLVEGWTAYYDDLLCRRAGLLRREDYLAIVARNIDALWAAPGRRELSLSESSFDAWIRLYRPDANTRNSSQNYYANGALAALCLDLFLRQRSAGEVGLDDVVRRLYAITHQRGRGYTRQDVDAAVQGVGGPAAVQRLAELVDGPLEPDFGAVLAIAGIRLRLEPSDRPHFGVAFAAGGTLVASVERGSPADEAGVAPGDEILAVQGLRVDAARWAEVWQAAARPDAILDVLVSRRGVITQLVARPRTGRGTTSLQIDAEATSAQVRLRDAWLGPEDGTAQRAAAPS
ncbi:MAG: M61 family metallopeptidase [Planctomycetes bacterium]|nr:M61 family metallopeptidase [Planctomycetota bacterium]